MKLASSITLALALAGSAGQIHAAQSVMVGDSITNNGVTEGCGVYPVKWGTVYGSDTISYSPIGFSNTSLCLGIMGKDYLVIKPTGNVCVTKTLYATEVRVQAYPFPDYVFADGYRLMPLNEVDAYIGKERHLPGMPAAAEIEKDGMPVSQIVVKQMEKIEELTLHAIALKKENDQLANANIQLAERLARIEAKLGLTEGK